MDRAGSERSYRKGDPAGSGSQRISDRKEEQGLAVRSGCVNYAEPRIRTTEGGGRTFVYSAPALALAIIVYGAIASRLPVWLLLAPRDYISYISGRAGRNGWGPLRNGEDDSAALRRSPASGAPSTRPRSPEALRSARM